MIPLSYIPALTGLRYLAALGVLFCHFSSLLPQGLALQSLAELAALWGLDLQRGKRHQRHRKAALEPCNAAIGQRQFCFVFDALAGLGVRHRVPHPIWALAHGGLDARLEWGIRRHALVV